MAECLRHLFSKQMGQCKKTVFQHMFCIYARVDKGSCVGCGS